MRRLALLGIVFLTACGPRYMWVKEGATQQDFEADRTRCIYEAKLATASYSSGPTARGYGAAAAQGIGEGITMGLREAELATLCMQTKGYRQAPIASAPSYAASTSYAPSARVSPSAPTEPAEYPGDGALVTCKLPDGESSYMLG